MQYFQTTVFFLTKSTTTIIEITINDTHAGSCALGLLAAAGGALVTASSFAAAAASSRRASSRRLADRFSCLFRFLRSALVRAGGAPVAASEDGAELSSLSAVENG